MGIHKKERIKSRNTCGCGRVRITFLVSNSYCVITDSGGIQEETTVLNIPCITLRENTERPITLIENGGTNMLTNIDNLYNNVLNYGYLNYKNDLANGYLVDGLTLRGSSKALTDGLASERIKAVLLGLL